MERYFIKGIILYAVFVLVYLLWERTVIRRRKRAKTKSFSTSRITPESEVIGKSNFTLRNSKQQATSLEISGKQTDNPSIFAGEIGQADVPETLGKVETTHVESGSLPDPAGDISGEIDIFIENELEGEMEPGYDDGLDYEETEVDDEQTGGRMALGIGFDELSGAIRTVETAEKATEEQREEAGRVLAEVRKTELFNQVAPDETRKKIVSSLMDDYFATYYRKREAQPQPAVKAPKDFDVRSFA